MSKIKQLIEQINNTSTLENGKWGRVHNGWSVEVEVGELLYGLVRATKSSIIVETGTGNCYSTMHILDAIIDNGHGFLYTFDVRETEELKLIDKYYLWYKFINGDSVVDGKELMDSLTRMFLKEDFLDMIFLDADHNTESVLEEFEVFFPHLKVGGIVCFHDTIQDKNEDRAVQQISTRRDINIIRLATSRGFDIGVKEV